MNTRSPNSVNLDYFVNIRARLGEERFDGSSMSPPSQIVPEVEMEMDTGSGLHDGPKLKIIEQPLDRFRFRYQSEMMGPHGSLPGRNQTEKGRKGCPVVELCGYNKNARIKCTLVSVPRRELHPHKLVVRDQTDDVMESVDVEVGPSYGGYIAGFEGMGIVHTAKKDVVSVLLQKYQKMYRYRNMDFEKAKAKVFTKCKNSVKEMDLNKVCLCFSAHDLITKEEICEPVYSDVINNLKAAATGVLRIVDYSKSKGLASGGDRIYMLVEKVMKKKIKIRFFSDDGDEPWSDWGKFSELDVHHQYAIVFTTPPYSNPNPDRDVKVWMQLYRTTDGATSAPRPFVYKANPKSKKRRVQPSSSSSFSSIGSFKDQNYNIDEFIIPTTVLPDSSTPDNDILNRKDNKSLLSEILLTSGLRDKNLHDPMMPQMMQTISFAGATTEDKKFSNGSINTSDLLKQVLRDIDFQDGLEEDDILKAIEAYKVTDTEFGGLMSSKEMSIDKNTGRIAYDAHMVDNKPDFSKVKKSPKAAVQKQGQIVYDAHMVDIEPHFSCVKTSPKIFEQKKAQIVYDAHMFENAEPQSAGIQIIPKIVEQRKKEPNESFVNPIKDVDKSQYTENEIQKVTDIIDKLLVLVDKSSASTSTRVLINEALRFRMENNDSILHVLASCKATALLLKLERKLTSMSVALNLLNHSNFSGQTLLHYAVEYDLPDLLEGLLMNDHVDCNKMDKRGNSVVHCAVLKGRVDCLKKLLSGVNDFNLVVDNLNQDGFCPLLLCVKVESGACELTDLLLEAGCIISSATDNSGKNILHLAISEKNFQLIEHLLKRQYMRDLVNSEDLSGCSPLHMACVLKEDIALPIVKLLLEAGADPLQKVKRVSNETAFALVVEESAVHKLLREHIAAKMIKDEIKMEDEPMYSLDADLQIKEEENEGANV